MATTAQQVRENMYVILGRTVPLTLYVTLFFFLYLARVSFSFILFPLYAVKNTLDQLCVCK